MRPTESSSDGVRLTPYRRAGTRINSAAMPPKSTVARSDTAGSSRSLVHPRNQSRSVPARQAN